ncbi:excinuclease ABC subunit UvrC [Flammeovirga yaeyamensis]|uniref:UvrABC system protein C n=1 Tax=Flammeovirga yaeyamensis TaxID=367791 RepID=A0AAX1N2T7_9BACT|nr:excinuclease ABC subunit UvrC [Flammeovirga yaeyamensis]MBB3701088.1 excinuclease ABC subunit C [Flammeovirga yaeyamensis]NMF38083.1 excinuclease ABC subunit C [Flammeovirga yaeyamensis]QWG01855.1 excinuclease ABC subunit UvrC [Flammeovirga yaeyamensis]
MQSYKEELMNAVKNLPMQPGVYKYFNDEGKIIYIGKAKKLRNRVSSYFLKQAGLNRKTQRLVSEIRKLEFVVVDTEYDALLLENNLIKKNQPKYNILLKDDKTYPYICVTRERFPRVFSTRNIQDKRHKYFGPYPNGRQMSALLDLFKQLYKIRNCTFNLSQENVAAGKYSVCLEFHINNCLGPCEGKQKEEDYQQDIDQVLQILKGNLSIPKDYFTQKMQESVEQLAFEEAQKWKQKLDLLTNYQSKSLVVSPTFRDCEVYAIVSDEKFAYVNFIKITNGGIMVTESTQLTKKMDESDEELLIYAIMEFRNRYNTSSQKIYTNIDLSDQLDEDERLEFTVPKIGDGKKLIQLSFKNAMYYKRERETSRGEISDKKSNYQVLVQLKNELQLSEIPVHIECFDNSNIQGTNPVSACVVFKDGRPSKKDYRHFHVKTVEGPDDFASMEEAVYRRYRRLLDEKQKLPQLVIIDGGKGQLSSAVTALERLGLYGKLPVIGIAKKLEEIFFPEDPIPLHLSKKSRSLQLVQRLRDEAHRFGITFHRNLRSKGSIQSKLEEIPGIGPNTIQKLLKQFKTISNIKSAPIEEVAHVVGQSKAQKVKDGLA